MFDKLKHGTTHHDHMHRMNFYINRVKKLTNHMDVDPLLEDMRGLIEEYVMKNIEESK